MTTAFVITPPKRQISTALSLALRDFLHEWQISLCLILALAAVLTPLLVLFGLKTGIITTMTERLTSDPRNLEIKIIGNGRFDSDWFADVGERKEVQFLIPRTRTLAATISLQNIKSGIAAYDVEIIPSGSGDPLLPDGMIAPNETSVYLSHTVAGKLKLEVGDQVTGIIKRNVNGVSEVGKIDLSVRGVLPEYAFARDSIFVGIEMMSATEDYRDGYAVEGYGWPGVPRGDEKRIYAGARLYADRLDSVMPLSEYLRKQKLEIRTQAKEIETVRAIDRVLSELFYLIAGIGVLGYALSLAVSLWANVDRKRKELSLMRLMGYNKASVVLFPLFQAGLIAALGSGLSIGLYLIVEIYLNDSMSQNLAREEFVSRLTMGIYGATIVLTMLLAFASSVIGGMRAVGIDPAESLREV